MTPSPTAPNALATPVPAMTTARVRVFVDYWNFQITMNEKEGAERGISDHRFSIDWIKLGPWLAKKGAQIGGIASYSFDGVIIYASFNPKTAEGKKFNNWVHTFLNRQPGVRVECFERRPKALPRCPACHKEIPTCPHCNEKIIATVEKGVDTLIATDMIRLAWEKAYDLAVCASSDSDLVPAVNFLNSKAYKVIQAGFPPKGVDLATACWASFDVYRDREEIRRPPRIES